MMTVDELIDLCEGLVAGITVETLVGGLHADLLDRDPPINMGVLVRFISGERPEAGARFRHRDGAVTNIDPITVLPSDDDDFDRARHQDFRSMGQINKDGRLEIGGEGGSVTLP